MMAMLMAMTTLSLTACGDDDEDGPDGGSGIEGTWKASYAYEEDGMSVTEVEYVQFNKGGTCVTVDVYTINKREEVDVDYAKYSVSGNKLTIIYTDEDGTTEREECTFKIKGNTLTIYYEFDEEDESFSFTRVKNSEIEKEQIKN